MKLTNRVQLLVAVTTLALSLSAVFSLRQYSLNLHVHSQKMLAESLINVLQNIIVQDITDGNSLRVAKVLQNVKRDGIAIEFLYVARGKNIIVHSFEKDIPQFLREPYPDVTAPGPIELIRELETESGLVYEYSGPLALGSDNILHIGLNQSKIKPPLNNSTRYFLFLGLIIGISALLLASFFIRRESQQLSALSTAIINYGDGQPPDLKRFQNTTREIQSLVLAFEKASQKKDKTYLELAQKKNNIELTLNSIGDPVIITDAEGKIKHMNPVAERLTALSLKEAEGFSFKKAFRIIHADSRGDQESPVDRVLATGEIAYQASPTTLITKNGIERKIAHTASPISDEEKGIIGVILVFHDASEQYQLSDASYAASRRLQAMVDDMQTMVGLVELDGTLTFINNTPLKLFGIKDIDVLGKKLWETPWFNYDPAVIALIQQSCRDAVKGNSLSHELEIDTAEGFVWIDFRIHPIFDDQGKVKQIVPEAQDISRRKALDAELFSSWQRIKLYRDQSPAATIDWDPDHNIVGWNNAAEEIFGFSAEEAIGQSYKMIVPQGTMGMVDQIWDNLQGMSGGKISINENMTKDGDTIICEWHNCSIVNEAGELVGFSSFTLDVSARYCSEQALQNKEKQQREILDSMVDGIVGVDASGVVVSVNRATEKMFDCSAKDIGSQFSGFIAEPSRAEFDAFFQERCASDEMEAQTSNIETQGLKKDHSTFPLRLYVSELPKSSQKDRHFIFSCHDLSDIKQQEEQLRRAQKMDALGKLTGGIAHDYNNMLGIILGYSELLCGLLKDQPKLERYAQEMYRASERGAKLTNKLLAFSREKKTEANELDLNVALRNEQNMLEKTLTARIDLIFDLEDNLWPVYLEGSDFEDAIINLSINAQHAMEGQGLLTIQTRNTVVDKYLSDKLQLPLGDYVQMSFTDTGCGIDREILSKIFDPFYSTKGDMGTGLGLSQVYGFVERSKGSIRVYSEIGEGTQFNLYFPRYVAEGVKEEGSNRLGHDQPGGNETILVVDDEPALLEVTSEILGNKGYTVLRANSAHEAIETLEKMPVDLLLSDVIMPEMDGYELANIVQKKYPSIKIQLASGFSDNRHVSLLDEALRKQIINKPYKGGVLLRRVREVLDS